MAVKLLSTISAVTKTAGNKSYLGKSITETITNGFFTVDHKWTVKYWNKAAEKLLRVKAKDIVGKNLWEEFAELIPLNFYAVYHKAFLQVIPLHFEEYWGEMGTWFDVITYHCDDTLSVSFKTSQPVHPEQPQQQLKMLNELYRFVTEVTNDCLWEWDLTTMEIFWIDGGHKRVFGYQIENALIPQSFWESRLHPDDRIRVLTRLKKFISGGSGSLWEEEYRFEKADGNYAYVHDRGHIFYDDEKVACRMIGATQDITSKKLTEIKLLEERRSRQKKITNAVLTAQENERAEIGKELHDNLNQILGATKLYIEMAKTDEVNRQMCLEKSSGYIVNVIEEIRKISKTLVAPGLALIGLVDSIKNLLEDSMMIHPMEIIFHEEGIDENDLNKKLQLNIFRIVQEQLNNILKHSKATHVIINLTQHANEIILLISDNGNGCDIYQEKTGVGIINIKSRAELCHGTTEIKSMPGEGYELKVVLPLNG